MKTTNWQTKALTLFIAAVALWVATACNSEGRYQHPYQIITPSAPCGPDVPLTPSIEFITLEGARVPEEYEEWLLAAQNPRSIFIEDEEDRKTFIHNVAAMARAERLEPEMERIRAARDKYRDRISKQYLSNVPDEGGYIHGVGVIAIYTEDGEVTDKTVILIDVTEYVDQGTLPPEDRIPECMEGIEVHFRVMPLRPQGVQP